MSSQKGENFDTKVEVGKKLKFFLEKKDLTHAEVARAVGADRQNVGDWIKSGAMPAWALLNLFRAYRDAADFFLTTAPLKENLIVAEIEFGYHRSQGKELISLIKEFVLEAEKQDEDIVVSLVGNVKGFLELIRRRKQPTSGSAGPGDTEAKSTASNPSDPESYELKRE